MSLEQTFGDHQILDGENDNHTWERKACGCDNTITDSRVKESVNDTPDSLLEVSRFDDQQEYVHSRLQSPPIKQNMSDDEQSRYA